MLPLPRPAPGGDSRGGEKRPRGPPLLRQTPAGGGGPGPPRPAAVPNHHRRRRQRVGGGSEAARPAPRRRGGGAGRVSAARPLPGHLRGRQEPAEAAAAAAGGGPAAPGLAAAMASLFKKKTVDGEWGAGPPAPGGGPRRPSRSPGAAAPSPRTVPGAELAPAWARGGAGARARWRRLRGGGLGLCVLAERELAGRGGGHSPPGVTHRRRSGQAGRRGESPGRVPGGWAGWGGCSRGIGPCGAAGPGRGAGAGPR